MSYIYICMIHQLCKLEIKLDDTLPILGYWHHPPHHHHTYLKRTIFSPILTTIQVPIVKIGKGFLVEFGSGFRVKGCNPELLWFNPYNTPK